MSIQVLLAQVLVLAFTAALWWIARRDLAARQVPVSADPAQPDTAEMEQLCATLETLVTRLASRLDAVEARQSDRATTALPSLPPWPAVLEPAPIVSAEPPAAPTSADPRYQAAEALLAAGQTDPAEVARQTGLGRGEVDLMLTLRGRRA